MQAKLADMGDLSTHFSAWEFRCLDGTTHEIDAELIDRLERLRSVAGGRPLRIVSGYRSPAYNRAVGGAPNSQHMFGRAADIPLGYATVRQATDVGFRGIGFQHDFAIHVDVRPGPPVAFPDP